MKKSVIVLLFIFFFCGISSAQEFTIVTENFSPFNYMENNESKGLAVEILHAVLKEMQIDIPIKFYPWARAYMMAQNNPNTLIFSLARNPEREKLFKWAGEIVSYDSMLYKINSRKDIQIKSLKEAMKYRVGAINKSAPAEYLISLGFDVDLVTDYSQNLIKIYFRRIDLIPYNKFSLFHEAPLAGYDPDDFQPTIILNQIHLYYAFSKQTSDERVSKFQEALKRVKKSGLQDKIIQKYLSKSKSPTIRK